ncbi:hypothetical protein BN844_4972 [Pseudomonas sp. SHC52]|nr:hypothetical protein BN844_4972 [Pseudomonas sp. SHC52]
MPFASKQAGRRIQADPAGAGQVDLAPGMQVGEVHFGTGRTVEAFHIGGQLNQVTGDEPCGQAQVSQQLHQQPGRVAAGTGRLRQGMLRGLDTGLHADQIADVIVQALVERHQEIHRRQRRAVDAIQVRLEFRRQRQRLQVRHQLVFLIGPVGEWNLFGVGFEEKIERIEHRHFRQQIDLDPQFFGFLGEYQARQVIALGILLPVDEVLLRRNLQRIGKNPRTAVGRGAQAHDLRAEFNGPVVTVMRDVMQCDMDRHGVPPANLGGIESGARLMPCRLAGHFLRLLKAVEH